MDLPTLLPQTLSYTSQAKDDVSLLALLAKVPSDLIHFFEYACGDETWSEKHSFFMQTAIEWIGSRFFEEQLSESFAKRAVAAIQEHYHILDPCIPRNLILCFDTLEIPINSLLWEASSSYFHALIGQQCRGSSQSRLILEEGVSSDVFFQIEEYIFTGKIRELWRREQAEIIEVLRQASEWKLPKLMEICQEILCRYITKDNAITHLIQAHEEGWPLLKVASMERINALNLGVRFEVTAPYNRLSFEFLTFYDEALAIFERVRLHITDLACSQSLTEQSDFSEVIHQCPKLVSLDVSGSLAFSQRLLSLPEGLKELNLAKCSWIDPKTLRQIFDVCPKIYGLSLASNTHINYSVWGVLRQLKSLTGLDISRCTQVGDADCKVILQACRHLTSLSLRECSGLSDQAFYELGKQVPQLIQLDISRCNIYDAALIDLSIRCKRLSLLDISRCVTLTEKGVREAMRNSVFLQRINLASCGFTIEAIQKIQESYPHVIVEGIYTEINSKIGF